MNNLLEIIEHMKEVDILIKQAYIQVLGINFSINSKIEIHISGGYKTINKLANITNKNIKTSENLSEYKKYFIDVDDIKVIALEKRNIAISKELEHLRAENAKLKQELKVMR